MMRTRLVSGALTLTLACALLSGCGQGGASTETAGTPTSQDVEETVVELEPELGPGTVDLGALLDAGVPMADAPVLSSSLVPVASGAATESNASAIIDYSNTADGYFMVSWLEGGTPKIKVLVAGPSGTTYQYNLKTDGSYETFPLSDGNGAYTIGIYKNISGTQYSTVLSLPLTVTLTDEFGPFIRSNQYVNYTADCKAAQKAAELCAGVEENLEKVSKVYDYVINNTVYDYDKAATVQSGYLPVVDETLETGKGICFDYAALMSAMLRSQNVPVKLIVGYTGDVYHAWINVWSETEGWIEGSIYFDGQSWKLMDPTFASTGKGNEAITQYIGNGSNYTAKYQY